MTIRHMKIFIALVEEGCNTTKAASRLNMTQPGVSFAVKELEEHYGIRFFDRLGRRLVLNDAGQEFLAVSRHIVTSFDSLEKRCDNWDCEGVIRIGASITIGSRFMPAFVNTFSSLHPGLDIRVLIEPVHLLEERLLDNSIDIALVEGAVYSNSLVSQEFMDDELIGVVSPSSGIKNGEVVSQERFRSFRLLLREKGSGTRDTFDLACVKAGFQIEPVWESVSTAAIVEAVIASIGVAVLPVRMVSNAASRGLVNLFRVEGLEFSRSFAVVHHRDKYLSSVLKEFISFILDWNEDYPLPLGHGIF